MTEQEFIAKYRGNETGFWVESASALFWARSYNMPTDELREMAWDYASIPLKNPAACSVHLARLIRAERFPVQD